MNRLSHPDTDLSLPDKKQDVNRLSHPDTDLSLPDRNKR